MFRNVPDSGVGCSLSAVPRCNHPLSSTSPSALCDSPEDSLIHTFSHFTAVYRSRDSCVWRAVEKATGLQVAIKAFRRQNMHAGHVFRMTQEMINLSCLQGSHVASVVCVFEDVHHFYLCTEWCPGGDLRQHLLATRMDERTIVEQVLVPLLSVLSRMHATGVMHRDIKPENLLLSSDGSIQLGDFGLSINFMDNIPFSCVGTTGYMAPEVLANEHALLNEGGDVTPQMLVAHKAQRYTAAVDVWSVGVLAKELMIAANGQPGSTTCAAKVAGPLSSSPLLWWDFVNRACDVNPLRRATAQQLLNHPWLQLHLSPPPRSVAPKLLDHAPLSVWPLGLVDGGSAGGHKPHVWDAGGQKAHAVGADGHKRHAVCARPSKAADLPPPLQAAREVSCRAPMGAPAMMPLVPAPRTDSCASFVSLDLGNKSVSAHKAAAAASAPQALVAATSGISSTCCDSDEPVSSPVSPADRSPPVHRPLSSSFTSVSLSSPSATWHAGATADPRSCYSDLFMPSRQCRVAWRQQELGRQDSESGGEEGDGPAGASRRVAPASGQMTKALRKARKAWKVMWSGVRGFV